MKKKWTLLNNGGPSGNEISAKMGISNEVFQVMKNRGVETEEEIKMYVNTDLEDLRDPFLLKDMEKAVTRIRQAIENDEKICIYGDYDVDGVSSTSILLIYFKSIGYEVDYYIPNRLEEGYGLNIEAVDVLREKNINLIITVDCGITSVKEVEYAYSLGIEVIVTDHHECQEEIPKAYAVVDPKQKDCSYPFKGICGCGVAFKLIHALCGDDEFFKNINKYLEITTLATICDIMPALDENRIIVKNGLEIMGKGENIGMRELVEVCELSDKKFRTSQLGFTLGPRINASGRLGFSNLGVQLFTSDDIFEARRIAELMDEKNSERQLIESSIYKEAEQMIRDNPDFLKGKILVLSGEGWNHGIIGIVASKITEKYYLPSILLGIDGETATGSARSIKGFDIFSALCECKDMMSKFGGHEQAAGMTVYTDKIDELRKKLNEIADCNLTKEELIEEIKIEYEINPKIIDVDLVDRFHILEPFGVKNPDPFFLIRNCLVKMSKLIGKDKNHLKIVIEKEGEFDCIGFSMAHLSSKFDVGDYVDLVFKLDKNTFNGKTNVQLMLKDIRLNTPGNIVESIEGIKKSFKLVESEVSRLNKGKYKFNSDLEEKTYSDNFLDIIDDKYGLKRTDKFGDGDLLVVNTLEGCFRLESDINLSDVEKIDYIFLSNIEKCDFKRYNNIIIYDYFNSRDEYDFIIENKKDESELILNFDTGDYDFLDKKMDNFRFDRDDFVRVYKYIFVLGKKNTEDYFDVGILNLVSNLRIHPIKLFIILNVLGDENLLEYELNFDSDRFNFRLLPSPKNKLDLEKNKIIIGLKNMVETYQKSYSL